jgi:hypothetical protein
MKWNGIPLPSIEARKRSKRAGWSSLARWRRNVASLGRRFPAGPVIVLPRNQLSTAAGSVLVGQTRATQMRAASAINARLGVRPHWFSVHTSEGHSAVTDSKACTWWEALSKANRLPGKCWLTGATDSLGSSPVRSAGTEWTVRAATLVALRKKVPSAARAAKLGYNRASISPCSRSDRSGSSSNRIMTAGAVCSRGVPGVVAPSGRRSALTGDANRKMPANANGATEANRSQLRAKGEAMYALMSIAASSRVAAARATPDVRARRSWTTNTMVSPATVATWVARPSEREATEASSPRPHSASGGARMITAARAMISFRPA